MKFKTQIKPEKDIFLWNWFYNVFLLEKMLCIEIQTYNLTIYIYYKSNHKVDKTEKSTKHEQFGSFSKNTRMRNFGKKFVEMLQNQHNCDFMFET